MFVFYYIATISEKQEEWVFLFATIYLLTYYLLVNAQDYSISFTSLLNTFPVLVVGSWSKNATWRGYL